MKQYDYKDNMMKDIRAYIKAVYSIEEIADNLSRKREEWEDELYNRMLESDNITGNASNTYTRNKETAEEYICHNWKLLGEAVKACGDSWYIMEEGAEVCDVAIRCYLLEEALHTVLDEMACGYYD